MIAAVKDEPLDKAVFCFVLDLEPQMFGFSHDLQLLKQKRSLNYGIQYGIRTPLLRIKSLNLLLNGDYHEKWGKCSASLAWQGVDGGPSNPLLMSARDENSLSLIHHGCSAV